jgi:hypothetical protein
MSKTIHIMDPHMAYVRCASELAARRSQVRALRKIAKRLYDAALSPTTDRLDDAIRYYEGEMK